jgi:hypothetical protein
MNDMRKHLERFRTDAAERAIISGLATDKMKRELFARLSLHLMVLAEEVEETIVAADGAIASDESSTQ